MTRCLYNDEGGWCMEAATHIILNSDMQVQGHFCDKHIDQKFHEIKDDHVRAVNIATERRDKLRIIKL